MTPDPYQPPAATLATEPERSNRWLVAAGMLCLTLAFLTEVGIVLLLLSGRAEVGPSWFVHRLLWLVEPPLSGFACFYNFKACALSAKVIGYSMLALSIGNALAMVLLALLEGA